MGSFGEGIEWRRRSSYLAVSVAILALIGAAMTAGLFSEIRDAVRREVERQTTLEQGSAFVDIWRVPPIVPKTR